MHGSLTIFFNPHLRIYFLIFRERGKERESEREREREGDIYVREKHWSFSSHIHLAADQTHNLLIYGTMLQPLSHMPKAHPLTILLSSLRTFAYTTTIQHQNPETSVDASVPQPSFTCHQLPLSMKRIQFWIMSCAWLSCLPSPLQSFLESQGLDTFEDDEAVFL